MGTINRRLALSGSMAAVMGTMAVPRAVAGTDGCDLLDKVVRAGHRFHLSENGLRLEASAAELRSRYGFSTTQVRALRHVLQRANDQQTSRAGQDAGVVAAGRLLYLSHSDLTVGTAAALTAAAEVGPAALAAAWAVFSASFSGPLGIATAILGGAFFADFAVKIVQAVATGHGIGIYSSWGLPPLKVEVE